MHGPGTDGPVRRSTNGQVSPGIRRLALLCVRPIAQESRRQTLTERAHAIGQIELASAPVPGFFYSRAIRRSAEPWTFGKVSMDLASSADTLGDITGQAKRVPENISAVNRPAGCDLSHVMSSVTCVTGRPLVVFVDEVRAAAFPSSWWKTTAVNVCRNIALVGTPKRVPRSD